MKRLIAVFMIVALLAAVAACCCAPLAVAESGAISPYQDAYRAFSDFASQFAERTVGTEYEHAAANWLAQQLASWGYTDVNGFAVAADMCVPFTFEYTTTESYYMTKTVTEHSYNVVAYKRCGVEGAPLLVIAAPYSNEKSYVLNGETLKLEDAAYSATSVGTLLSIAVKLYSAKLSFDVAFAFMGAEYFYSAGTKEFISANTQPLLGAIYLSQVGVGDHLNVYYDEVDTTHGAYVDSVIAKWKYDVQGKPFDPGYYTQIYGGDLPYAHVGISGGNYVFMQEGVPAVHLFGYNWTGLTGSESAMHEDVVFTEDDNKANFLHLYDESAVRARLGEAADLVTVLTLSDGDFAQALGKQAQPSYHGLVSDAAYYGLKYGLLALIISLIVLIAVLTARRSKRAEMPDFAVNSTVNRGDGVPPTDDVFGEGGAIRGDSDDVDGADAPDNNDNNTGNPPDTNDIFGEF